MSALKILHAADLHLDSPFEALGASKAALRRGEQRELLGRIADLAIEEKVDLVLFAGDLLDSDNTFYETGEELVRSLRRIGAPVFIAPGNHDYYSERSPYARLKLPENIHVFTSREISCFTLKELGVRVYGAAFTDRRSEGLLQGFHAPRGDGFVNLLCLHGEVGVRDSAYNPISEEELALSGIDYAALGHVHRESELRRAGSTAYAWPGCPEGRGFDETGEKHVYLVRLEGGRCEIDKRCVASGRVGRRTAAGHPHPASGRDRARHLPHRAAGRGGRAAGPAAAAGESQRVLFRTAAARRDPSAARHLGQGGRGLAARSVPAEAACALRRRGQ